MRPLGPALVTVAVVVGALAFDNPYPLGVLAAGAAGLAIAAGPPRRLAFVFAVGSATFVFAVNPWVSVQGLTPLWTGPNVPVLDAQATVEELAFGAGAAMRLVAVALATAAFVRAADADLLVRAVGRVAPRSALVASLSAQLLPALERDATALSLAARTRGARLATRTAGAALVPALLASSLERSLAIAEAMEARGYGSGRRTRAPEPAPRRVDRALTAIGIAALALVAAGIAAGAGDYTYYPLTHDPTSGPALALAAAVGAALGAATVVIRWAR